MSIKCWEVIDNTGRLFAGSKSKKAYNEARGLLKKEIDLEFQVSQRHIVELMCSDKEIKCFLGTNTGNFKVMYILSEEQLRLLIEESFKFLNGEDVQNKRIDEIMEMKKNAVVIDAEDVEETEPEIKF